MQLTEGKTLLVCASESSAEKLKQLLRDRPAAGTAVAKSAGEARRLTAQDSYALVVVNAPLPDESGLELCMELTQNSMAAVVLLVKNELMSFVYTPATEAGVLVLGKPLNAQAFGQTMQLAMAMRSRLLLLTRENEKLHKKLEEIRLIDRAKCLLIEHMRISETEAHRAIEKQAMDERVPRVQVARQLLAKFEL